MDQCQSHYGHLQREREREKERKREASEREEFGRDKEQGKHLV